MDWNKTTVLLIEPLKIENVVKPTGNYGPKGDYIEGWHAINEANRIFGFGGWSYTTDLKFVSDLVNSNGNHEIGYICKCRLTVDGVTREDVGYGSGAAKKAGDAHEGAVKEAVTDALKRALRTFGNQFGLALYDKKQANVSAPELHKPDFAAIRDRLKLKISVCKTVEQLQALWENDNHQFAALSDGDEPKYKEVRSEFSRRGKAIKTRVTDGSLDEALSPGGPDEIDRDNMYQ